jgi:hypothetical protein
VTSERGKTVLSFRFVCCGLAVLLFLSRVWVKLSPNDLLVWGAKASPAGRVDFLFFESRKCGIDWSLNE